MNARGDRMSDRVSPSPRTWRDRRHLKVLGMGAALPGPAISTADLLGHPGHRSGVTGSRWGPIVAKRLGTRARHICRDFAARREAARPGHSNPELAAAALRTALREARLGVGDLAYLVGHTATPAW